MHVPCLRQRLAYVLRRVNKYYYYLRDHRYCCRFSFGWDVHPPVSLNSQPLTLNSLTLPASSLIPFILPPLVKPPPTHPSSAPPPYFHALSPDALVSARSAGLGDQISLLKAPCLYGQDPGAARAAGCGLGWLFCVCSALLRYN